MVSLHHLFVRYNPLFPPYPKYFLPLDVNLSLVYTYTMATGKRKVEKLTETLRRLVAGAKSLRHVAAATGLDHGNLGKFVRHEIVVGGESMDKLAEHFGLELQGKK